MVKRSPEFIIIVFIFLGAFVNIFKRFSMLCTGPNISILLQNLLSHDKWISELSINFILTKLFPGCEKGSVYRAVLALVSCNLFKKCYKLRPPCLI